MKYQQLIDLLNSYGNITKEEEMSIRKTFVIQKVNKKELLIHENFPCNKLFFINKGLLRIFYVNDKGNEFTRMIAWENRFLTNMISFKNLGDNNEIIECIENAEILYIKRDTFNDLMKSSLNLKSIYADILEDYNANNVRRFQELNNNNIKVKMETLKYNFPQLIGRVNDVILSTFLGISRETFVRNKRSLND